MTQKRVILPESARCENCSKLHSVEDLLPCGGFWERYEQGQIPPAGDCPDCGAFCYFEDSQTPYIQRVVGILEKHLGDNPELGKAGSQSFVLDDAVIVASIDGDELKIDVFFHPIRLVGSKINFVKGV